MQSTKWKKYRVSRYKFPTKVQQKGCPAGYVEARKHLEAKLGISLKDAKIDHTRGEWIFKLPLE